MRHPNRGRPCFRHVLQEPYTRPLEYLSHSGRFPLLREAAPAASKATCDLNAPSATPSGAMSAAAHSFPVDRMSDWLEELERIMKAFDALPSAAQAAVKSVVESLVRDPDTSDAEIAHSTRCSHATPHIQNPGSGSAGRDRRALPRAGCAIQPSEFGTELLSLTTATRSGFASSQARSRSSSSRRCAASFREPRKETSISRSHRSASRPPSGRRTETRAAALTRPDSTR